MSYIVSIKWFCLTAAKAMWYCEMWKEQSKVCFLYIVCGFESSGEELQLLIRIIHFPILMVRCILYVHLIFFK